MLTIYKPRGAVVMNLKIKEVIEDSSMHDRLSKIPMEELRKKTSDGLLPCWKCGGRFIDISPGSHKCEGEVCG